MTPYDAGRLLEEFATAVKRYERAVEINKGLEAERWHDKADVLRNTLMRVLVSPRTCPACLGTGCHVCDHKGYVP